MGNNVWQGPTLSQEACLHTCVLKRHCPPQHLDVLFNTVLILRSHFPATVTTTLPCGSLIFITVYLVQLRPEVWACRRGWKYTHPPLLLPSPLPCWIFHVSIHGGYFYAIVLFSRWTCILVNKTHEINSWLYQAESVVACWVCPTQHSDFQGMGFVSPSGPDSKWPLCPVRALVFQVRLPHHVLSHQ